MLRESPLGKRIIVCGRVAVFKIRNRGRARIRDCLSAFFVPFCPTLGQAGTRSLLKTKGLALVPLVSLSHKKNSNQWSVASGQRLSKIDRSSRRRHNRQRMVSVTSRKDIAFRQPEQFITNKRRSVGFRILALVASIVNGFMNSMDGELAKGSRCHTPSPCRISCIFATRQRIMRWGSDNVNYFTRHGGSFRFSPA
jgi:hypothetical protein